MSKKLYIIHGWAYSIEPWNSVVEKLKESGIDVKQLRVPGLTVKNDKIWTIDDYVDWLQKELVGVERPIILGHSNGGRIALNYAVKYPKSLSHLILLNSAGMYDNSAKVSLKRRLLRILSKILGPIKYIPFARKVVYKLIGASDYNAAPTNMKKTLSNMINSDRTLSLTKVEVDTTIIWGLKDETTPIEQGRKMKQLIPNSTLIEFADWQHSPYKTHPTELANVIIEVMEKI